MDEFKDYIQHGEFVFYAVVPLSFCKISKSQLFVLPGGRKVTEKFIRENIPKSIKSMENPPRIKR